MIHETKEDRKTGKAEKKSHTLEDRINRMSELKKKAETEIAKLKKAKMVSERKKDARRKIIIGSVVLKSAREAANKNGDSWLKALGFYKSRMTKADFDFCFGEWASIPPEPNLKNSAPVAPSIAETKTTQATGWQYANVEKN